MPLSVQHELREYAQATFCVVASTACAFVLQGHVQSADLAMIQLLGIVVASMLFSVRAAITACVIGILAFDFLLIPPAFSITPGDLKSSAIFVGMLVVAAVISGLNQRLRLQEQLARAEAFRAESLFTLNSELSRAQDVQQVNALTARHVERLFAGPVTIVLRTADGALARLGDAAGAALAERAFVRNEFTVGNSMICLPIAGVHATLGVLGLRVTKPFAPNTQHGFHLTACVNQLASALERVQLSNAVRRTELEAESERMRSTLLSAVSHDLKTPLATILAAATTLIGERNKLDAPTSDALLGSIVGEADRLSRLIQNLLSIARLESPTIELRRTPEAIDEIIQAAVDRFSARYRDAIVKVELEPDLPLVSVEPLLTEQVLTNLLENAARHAGANAQIKLVALAADGMVRVQVEDDGPGIPEDEREKVFEKFYRGRGAGRGDGGVGLGLTICRAIVRAHGGRIYAALAQRDRGTLIEFTLPLSAAWSSSELLRERYLVP